MRKIIKTASILTSGIIVGALVRKITLQGLFSKQSSIDSIKSVKNLFNSSFSEEGDNYFI
jgi:hypothetical protein